MLPCPDYGILSSFCAFISPAAARNRCCNSETTRAPQLRLGVPPASAANSVATLDASANDAAQWHPAVVPGCVHLDLLRNKLIPDPFYRDNEAKLQWIENADWEYRTTVQATPALLAQKNIDLVFEGLDAYAKVYLNDKLILTADNMFREWRVSVKADLKPGANHLRVVFPSPIKAASEIAANDPWRERTRTEAENLPPQSRLRVRLGLGTALRHQRHLASRAARSLGHGAHLQRPHSPARREQQRRAPARRSRSHGHGSRQARPSRWTTESPAKQLWNLPHRAVAARRESRHAAHRHRQSRISGIPPDTARSPSTSFKFNSRRASSCMDEATRQDRSALGRTAPRARSMGTLLRVRRQRHSRIRQRRRRHSLRQLPHPRHHAAIPPGAAVGGGRQHEHDPPLGRRLLRNRRVLRPLRRTRHHDLAGLHVRQRLAARHLRLEAQRHRAKPKQQVRRLRNHPSIVIWCGNNETEVALAWKDRDKLPAEVRFQMWQDYVSTFSGILAAAVNRYAPETPYWPSSPSADYEAALRQVPVRRHARLVGVARTRSLHRLREAQPALHDRVRLPVVPRNAHRRNLHHSRRPHSTSSRRSCWRTRRTPPATPSSATTCCATIPSPKTSPRSSMPARSCRPKASRSAPSICAAIARAPWAPSTGSSTTAGPWPRGRASTTTDAGRPCTTTPAASTRRYWSRLTRKKATSRSTSSPTKPRRRWRRCACAFSTFDGAVLSDKSQPVTIAPLASKVYLTMPMLDITNLPNCDLGKIFAVTDLLVDNKVISSNTLFFVPKKDMQLPQAKIEVRCHCHCGCPTLVAQRQGGIECLRLGVNLHPASRLACAGQERVRQLRQPRRQARRQLLRPAARPADRSDHHQRGLAR